MADRTLTERTPDDSRMPFIEHLRELRLRLRNSVIALVAGFAVAYTFHQELFVILLQPLLDVWAQKQAVNPELGPANLNFGSLIEPFWTYFSLSFWAGIFVASPLVFHQLWKFVAPGLYSHEKKMAVPFAVVSAIFFCGGAVFCYFMVLPPIFEFFLDYSSQNLSSMQSVVGDYTIGTDVVLRPTLFMKDYLDMAKRMLIGFGLVFELPLFIGFLAKIGLVTHRSLWKFNRWAIILAFVAAAILTPPDPVSQIMMAVPLVALYNLSILVAWTISRKKERELRALDDGPPPADDSPPD